LRPTIDKGDKGANKKRALFTVHSVWRVQLVAVPIDR